MKKSLIAAQVILGLSSLALYTNVSASTMDDVVVDPVTGVVVGTGNLLTDTTTSVVNAPWYGLNPEGVIDADYMVSDPYTGEVGYLDKIERGYPVSDFGNTLVSQDYLMGDEITDLSTGKSGVITGVKHQGTMDVVGDRGVTRYQYVTFKVKHVKHVK